jgi:hypothetical protein
VRNAVKNDSRRKRTSRRGGLNYGRIAGSAAIRALLLSPGIVLATCIAVLSRGPRFADQLLEAALFALVATALIFVSVFVRKVFASRKSAKLS